ncbi:Collagen alpha-1(XIII) chain [Flagellimonas maritima]|uniref:Collagen alpha-1(XIII) chain n=1 Tax=Flagellimonas maritima TaxID=1383885 RepID=A0A2Z4LWN2_9FLAO|nr:collagen-like protein [Allomuricauda aurantiaca]AWX46351.1 Collagen alpha-1(XIII) chain [Allomuricauda aurantiaca]
MKTIKLLNIAMICMAMIFISCSGEDGEDGLQGNQGQPGIQGEKGDKGDTGLQGSPGEDGNANVVNITFDASAHTGNTFQMDSELITEASIIKDAYLFYIKSVGNFYSVPGIGPLAAYSTRSYIGTGSAFINFRSVDGTANYSVSEGEVEEVRMVIIEGNDVTPSGKSGNILDQFKKDGVDLNDYHAVMAYLNK